MAEPLKITESAIINAAPSKVYAVLSDYHVGHPAILPKSFFKSLTVDEGGKGAGTVFTVVAEVFGTKSVVQMKVDEPKPGVVLREGTLKGDVVTTFTLEPVDNGTRTSLTIYTEQITSSGLRGFVERLLNPHVLRGVYRQELANVNEYVQK